MTVSCSCEYCRLACEQVPGWFTPEEASKAIDAGYAPRLSAVVERSTGTVAVIPSIVGVEGKYDIFRPGRCTFLNKEGLCEIHDTGFKPIECRTGYGCKPSVDYPTLEFINNEWNSNAGVAVIQKWEQQK